MNTIRLTALLYALSSLTHAAPLGTAFTYQGQLADAGQPAQGAYDFRLAIYDAASGGGGWFPGRSPTARWQWPTVCSPSR